MSENTEEQKDTVKFYWNDREIEAEPGSNLLKAALDNGEEVAHYCYHAGLPVAGVCRMCMVEQEGVPRMYPSCNANVQEGMKVYNNTEKVKDTVEWALQFHLLNHPLDCPICDQAGECGLQEYYMDHGQYDSNMVDQKVHKKKVQDIGKNVILDAERCILCDRCVRFTTHVTGTNELGILNRGDHAEITVHKQLENDYAMNLVDICPVGALTSKDFRFKQRVWFLDDIETTCIGCETGCSVKVGQNENGAFRVKPLYDESVNGYWMCDDGREIYKHVSDASRLQGAMENRQSLFLPTEETVVHEAMKGKNVKFVLSAGLTNEEYDQFFSTIDTTKTPVALYQQPELGEKFDAVLRRSGKDCNLKGATSAFEKAGVDSTPAGLDKLLSELSPEDVIFVVIPEFIYNEDHFMTLINKSTKAGLRMALTSNDSMLALKDFNYLLPLPTFLEKDGTIVNYDGQERPLRSGRSYGVSDKNVSYYANWVNA